MDVIQSLKPAEAEGGDAGAGAKGVELLFTVGIQGGQLAAATGSMTQTGIWCFPAARISPLLAG